MYLPEHFAERRPEVLAALMHKHGLADLVTVGPAGLTANHIPLEYDPSPAPLGTLRGHVARANPVWREASPEFGALAIFHGPQRYISPRWYPSSAETGMVVPTFNYLVVHAYGTMTAIEDQAWLRAFVERLTDRYEAGSEKPWRVSDAPSAFVDQQLRAIVGIEIAPTKLVGKWKVSQNRLPADREGVIDGLRATRDADDRIMADWVDEAVNR